MTWFEDLSPCTYFNRDVGETVLAVGWLERDHSYNKGPIREKKKVVDTLVRLLVDPWQPMYFLGYHACSLCRRLHTPLTLRHKGTQITMGATNVLVPCNRCIYGAPSLIAHYILDHGYAPPEPFCQALLACPPMGSTDYFRAVVSIAPDSIVAQIVREDARESRASHKNIPWEMTRGYRFPGLLGMSEKEISEP